MAFEGPGVAPFSFIAGGTITQYRFVKLSADKTVVQCTGATDKPIGVAQEAAVSGGHLAVCSIGITKVEGDADLAFGDSIGPSADGQAAAYTVSDTTKHIVGQVLEGNSAAAGLATAYINCPSSRVLA